MAGRRALHHALRPGLLRVPLHLQRRVHRHRPHAHPAAAAYRLLLARGVQPVPGVQGGGRRQHVHAAVHVRPGGRHPLHHGGRHAGRNAERGPQRPGRERRPVHGALRPDGVAAAGVAWLSQPVKPPSPAQRRCVAAKVTRPRSCVLTSPSDLARPWDFPLHQARVQAAPKLCSPCGRSCCLKAIAQPAPRCASRGTPVDANDTSRTTPTMDVLKGPRGHKSPDSRILQKWMLDFFMNSCDIVGTSVVKWRMSINNFCCLQHQ